MRAFIGLDLAPAEKLALESWRQSALPEVKEKSSMPLRKNKGDPNPKAIPVAVPAANYHITLCFLGHITPPQHEALVAQLNALTYTPFSLRLDSSGMWQGPKILFVAPQDAPDELMELARATRKAARAAGIQTDNRTYQPHVTLVRKVGPGVPLPLYQPDVTASFSQFHLFESVSGQRGVHYPVRQSWSLKPDLSIREQLKRGLV
tara:strand:- start:117 stop:731 length:615 start_codon:yes stop_codon:yes gene_type:complete